MKENQNVHADENVIDLLEIWYLFLQQLKFIVLAAVIGGIVAGAYTHFLIAPTYKATSQLYIVSASSDSVVNLSDLQIGTNLTADYKNLILSRPMLESTIQNLNLQEISVRDLRGMLSINNASGTRIIEITCTSTSPQQAADIANEVARLARVWLPEIMETNEPNLVESAIVPTSKAAPSLSKNTLLGAIVLAVVYFGICVVKHLADDTIRSSEEMERYFGIVPFAVIPESAEIDDPAETKTKKKKNNKSKAAGK